MARLAHAPLFRGRHFPDDLIILAVRWYLRYSLSYRDLQELLAERGVAVDHTTIWRWVDHYGPELDQRLRPYLRPTGTNWRMDETYVRVCGEWTYLYRAVDSQGTTVDFYLSRARDVRAAKLFLRKAMADAQRVDPEELVVDGNPTYPIAVRALQREGVLPPACQWRCPGMNQSRSEAEALAAAHGIRDTGFHGSSRGFATGISIWVSRAVLPAGLQSKSQMYGPNC